MLPMKALASPVAILYPAQGTHGNTLYGVCGHYDLTTGTHTR